VTADPATCSFQFNPTGATSTSPRSCDVAKRSLARASVSYTNETRGGRRTVAVGEGRRDASRCEAWLPDACAQGVHDSSGERWPTALVRRRGYPVAKRDPATVDPAQIADADADADRSWCIYVTMVYGPIAAMLVELFPTRIRYTSHVAAVPHRQRLVRRPAAGDRLRDGRRRRATLFYGLWYPIAIAVGPSSSASSSSPKTKDRDIFADTSR
jgi:hypothetical protein